MMGAPKRHHCTRGAGGRPCGRFSGPPAWGPDNCRACWLFANDPAYRRHWAERPAPPGTLRRGVNLAVAAARHLLGGLRCVEEGEYARRLTICRRCPNLAPDGDRCLHPQCGCTLSGDVLAKARWASERCPAGKWQVQPITTRHLLYHLYPRRGNGIWRWNVEQLLRRIGLFNGRRIVAVAVDATTDTPEAVRQAFAGAVTDFVVLPNAPGSATTAGREVITHGPLFERVATAAPGEVTLYAQAKAVTRAGHPTCQRWAQVLYETYLDYWPAVERVLGTYPLAGAFLKHGAVEHWGHSVSRWHYSGSWLWLRNAELFARPDWRRIDQHWSGIEPWPSLHFCADEAGVIFGEGQVALPQDGGMELYDQGYFEGTMMPAYRQWRDAHAGEHRPPRDWRGEFRALAAAWDAAGLDRHTSAEEMALVAEGIEAAVAAGAAGDVLECGCYTGYSSCCLSRACAAAGRLLHVADSFAGLPDVGHPTYRPGQFAAGRAEVEANLARFGRPEAVRLVPGWFRESLADWQRPLCCLWLDADLRESTALALVPALPRLDGRGRLFAHEAEPGDCAGGKVVAPPAREVWGEIARQLGNRPYRARFLTGCLGEVRFDP